jgi:hypothetical protein
MSTKNTRKDDISLAQWVPKEEAKRSIRFLKSIGLNGFAQTFRIMMIAFQD